MGISGKYLGVIAALALFGCGDDPSNQRATGGVSESVGDTGEVDPTDADDDDAESSTTDEPIETDSVSGSSEGGSEETGEGEVCDQSMFSFEVEAQTPDVMLVLDKSRSMTNLWDHDLDSSTADISRWHSLHNVVDQLLTDFSAEVNFGAQLFPAADAWLDEPTNAWSCRVEAGPEVAVGPGTAAAIMAAIPDGPDFSISGGTPAVAGLRNAVEHLEDNAGEGPRAIVFVTDGAANCNENELPGDTLFVYDQRVPDVIADAFTTYSIPVYVVGINILDEMGTKPEVNAYEAVTDAAQAGGAPAAGPLPFYNAFNEIDLANALEEVLDDIECTVNLDVVPTFPENVGVAVDGTAYDNVGDCDAQDGWTYTAPAGPFNAIQLCGAACNALQDGGLVEVDYLCPG
jgi:hypothetical protein